MVSLDGTLTYRARSDGSPYSVINQARGTYTELPEAGDKVGCGDVLYRVDDEPVLLLCGTVPAYRDLHAGDAGKDVRQLNRNLRSSATTPVAGDDASPRRRSRRSRRSSATRALDATGALALGDAVFLPEAGADRQGDRRARRTRPAGCTGRCSATSDTLEVQVDLEPSQQGEVEAGDRAQITLPGNTSVTGKVDRLGTRRPGPAGQDGERRRRDHPGLHQPRRPAQRHAGSTGPRSRWTSRPRAWRTP